MLQQLLGFKEPELLVDICLHFGTLVAVCVVFFKDIRSILTTLRHLPALVQSAGGFKSLYGTDPDIRMAVLIVCGSLPTAALGLLFHEIADRLFASVAVVGMMLLVTGTLLWYTRRSTVTGRPLTRMTLKDGLLIGLTQGLAILPGISRSGATISIALFLGIDRDVAGRYSFLLSLPAIIGALALSFDASLTKTPMPIDVIAAGTFAAFGMGYLALKLLLQLVRHGQLFRFAPYCWLVGIIVLAWRFWGSV